VVSVNSSDNAIDWVTISVETLRNAASTTCRIDADQQQIERIGEGPLDLELGLEMGSSGTLGACRPP